MGTLADVVVDVTAKAPARSVQAIRLARGGTIVVAGARITRIPGFDPDLLVYKELRIVGTLGVDAYRAALTCSRRSGFRSPNSCAAPRTSQRCPRSSATWPARATPPVHAVFVPHRALGGITSTVPCAALTSRSPFSTSIRTTPVRFVSDTMRAVAVRTPVVTGAR